MTEKENTVSSDELSFMYQLSRLDDGFDKLFPKTPDEYFKKSDADEILIKRNAVDEFVDSYENLNFKPFFKKIDLNNSDKNPDENKSKDAFVIGLDFSF